jgi:hypothetical protein
MKPTYEGLEVQIRLLTEQRDAVVVECQSKKSALEAILEHCPVNHPHIDAACAAMIAYDNLYCVETPATSSAIAALRAEGVEMLADFFSTANNGHEIHPDIDEMRLFTRQLRESKGEVSNG